MYKRGPKVIEILIIYTCDSFIHFMFLIQLMCALGSDYNELCPMDEKKIIDFVIRK